jgi:hypothetical protein
MPGLLLVRIQLTYTNHCMTLLEWIVDQATTTTLSSPIPNIVETTILPSPISNVEIANEGCQIGALELLEDLQVGINLNSIQLCAFKKLFFDSET